MINLKLIFLLTLFCCVKSYAQVEIRGATTIETHRIQPDTINLSPNRDFERRVKLKPIDKSQNDLEIRFYEKEELSKTITLKVLILKDSVWSATEYAESNYPIIRIKKSKLEAKSDFENVFKMLLQNRLLDLSSQEELKPKMKKYGEIHPIRGRSEIKIHVTDGQSYTVEFKIGDMYRVYSFDNPVPYAKHYDDVQELKDYVAIVDIFKTELKRK